jgi:hypothetical protein
MIKSLDSALEHLRIPYVIIGGIAASVLGRPRTTMDADVVILISKRRLRTFLNILKSNGFRIPPSREDKILEKLKRLLPVKISFKQRFSTDIRIASYSLDKSAIERALRIELFGKELPVASPEDIILYKIVRFSDLDKADMKAILSRFRGKLDLSYIRKGAQELIRETGHHYISENLHYVLQ